MLSGTSKNSGRKLHSTTLGLSAAVLLMLTLTLIPAFSPIPIGHATKPQPSPPPSTGTSWIKAYNIPYTYNGADSVAQTASGGYLLGGECTAGAVTTPTCSAPVSEPGAEIVKVDSSGNIQAQTQYGYASYPYTTRLGLNQPTSDGGAIFAGNEQFGCPATGKTSCALIVKVDPNGNVQWSNDLQFSTSCSAGPLTWPLGLQQSTDGGYVVAGYAYAPSCSYNPFVVKLSSTGQIQWQHLFTDPTSQYGATYSVQQTTDGGYVVVGELFYYVSSSYTDAEILVFRLDSTGTLVWQHAYSIGTDAYAESLALTSDGGFIVSGIVDTTTATSYSSSVLLLTLDSGGNPQFARTYLPSGSISSLTISGAQQTADGGYAFAGYYFQNTVYDQRAWLVKTDSAGNVQWDKIYGADVQYSDRSFSSFQQTSDGGFIAAGATNQYNNGYSSLWVVKTDSNGNISGCSEVKNDSATSGSATVKVSNTNLAVVKDGISYLADKLTSSVGALTATREC
jgi:hypothetical protein